jgi:hypothetical protein
MSDFYDKINYDDLNPDIQMIADVCGIESARMIIRHLGGLQFYIPKVTGYERFVNRFMDENKGMKLKDIAKELGVSEQYLKILQKRNSGNKRIIN